MKEDDAIDKKIREMIEKKEYEISAFKKLLEGLEKEPEEDKVKIRTKRKNRS